MTFKIHLRKDYRTAARVVTLESHFTPEVGKGGELIVHLAGNGLPHIFAAGSWSQVHPVVPAGALDSAAKNATLTHNAAEAAHTEAE